MQNVDCVAALSPNFADEQLWCQSCAFNLCNAYAHVRVLDADASFGSGRETDDQAGRNVQFRCAVCGGGLVVPEIAASPRSP